MAAKTKTAAKAKSKKPSKAQKIDWLESKTNDLVAQRQAFRDAAADFEEAHAASGLAKKKMDNEQAKLNAIVNDIADIKTGNFTPPLPFPEEGSKSGIGVGNDPGAAMPLNSLGLKSQLVGKLEKKLAKTETDIVTIGHLEELQRAKPQFWMKDLGLNADQTTLVQDAMEAFRKTNPMPAAEADQKVGLDDKVITRCADGSKISINEMVEETAAILKLGQA